jgi:hypothetical protein
MTAGRTCKAFVQIGGTFATPTWVEMRRISNVQRPKSRGTSDRMFRGARHKFKVAGYLEYGWTFTYTPAKAGSAAATADTVLTALENSLENETVLDVIFIDRALVTGAKGVRASVQCTKMDRKEDDEDSVTFDVELVLVEDEDTGGALREPIAYTVA